MSRPRDNWRPYVQNALRDYYMYRQLVKDSHSQKVTAQYNKGRGSRTAGRNTENAALRSYLTPQQQREYEAIERAVKRTRQMPDGKLRVKLVDMVYFRGTHTIEGAAQIMFISYGTAKKWTDSFIRMVGHNLGLE